MDASEKVVGVSGAVTVSGASNEVTITFKPTTMLDAKEGSIKVYSQPNFNALEVVGYVHDDDEFSCRSDQLYLPQTEADSAKAFFLVKYEFLTIKQTEQEIQAGVKPTITLICKNWWNPVSKRVMKGFRIKTFDKYDIRIDETDDQPSDVLAANLVEEDKVITFSLDASNFDAYPITEKTRKADELYGIPNRPDGANQIQGYGAYTIKVKTDVPLEYTGCYVKYIFPKELQIEASKLQKFKGAGMLLNDKGGKTQKPIASDYSQQKKWFIVKGCLNRKRIPSEGGKKPKKKTGATEVRKLDLTLENVGHPLALMDTSPFEIEIWKDYDAATGPSGKIAYLQIPIPASKYVGGALSTFSMSALNRIVQEGDEHTLLFETEKIVPAQAADASKYEIVPGIHIMFPPRIGTHEPKDEQTSQYDPVAVDLKDKCVITPGATAANTFTVKTTPGPLITIDESSTYDVDCQAQLCYVIAFNSDAAIQPTQFQVLLKNIVNPESIYPAADIRIRTMLRYSDSTEEKDKRYYFIDEATFDSGFHADKGTIETMQAEP